MTRLSALAPPSLVGVAGLLLLAGAARAQDTAPAPDAGPAPLPLADRPLSAADGSTLTFGSAAGPEGLVVVFWSTACPWTDRYAPRLADLVAGYAPAGVGFVLVTPGGAVAGTGAGAAADAGTPGGAVAPRTVARASSREPAASALAAPYVADADGALADAFGARSLPHAFFYGPDRTLVYDGAIDDSPADADRVRVPYLRQAMDQSVAGLPVEVVRTQAFGCTVRGRR